MRPEDRKEPTFEKLGPKKESNFFSPIIENERTRHTEKNAVKKDAPKKKRNIFISIIGICLLLFFAVFAQVIGGKFGGIMGEGIGKSLAQKNREEPENELTKIGANIEKAIAQSESEPEVVKALSVFVAEMTPFLPMRADTNLMLRRLESEGTKLISHLRFTNRPTQKYVLKFQSTQLKRLATNLCNRRGIRTLFEWEGAWEYVYTISDGAIVDKFVISKSECETS